MLYTFTIKDPVYFQHLDVCVGPLDDLNTWLTRNYGVVSDLQPSYAGGYFGLEDTGTHDFRNFLWLDEYESTVNDMAIVVHELQHFVLAAMDRVGMEASFKTTEAYSYYMGYMFKEAILELTKYEKKVNMPKKTYNTTKNAEHSHTVVLDGLGNGRTSKVEGHVHTVTKFRVSTVNKHSHKIVR